MRFLKALVVFMGMLIIAGVVIISVELYKRATDPERAAEKARESATSQPVGVPIPAASALGLPPGSRITEVVAVGSRALIKVSIPAAPDTGAVGEDRLYTLDPRDGAVAQVLTTGAAPEAPATVSGPDRAQ